jgi:hypothetical protein
MADGISPNFGLALPVTGTDAGTWGNVVNTNITGFIDSAFGNVLTIAMTVADVTLTLGQWQSGTRIKITGALTGNHILKLPICDPASATPALAVGGNFVVDNETTNTGGPWTITVVTAVGGSTGVQVAQGSRTALYSDGTNVWYADDSRTAKLNTNAGNPNGSVTGNAGAVNAPADMIWDRTSDILYVSTGGTTWASIGAAAPSPGGYLTPTVGGVPIIPGDALGQTSVYYTPYKTAQVPISSNGGVTFSVFPFAELAIGLSGISASDIRDVFVFLNSGAVAVGWGPSWTAGGSPGNITPGSCARGSGAGSTALARTAGFLTNANAITLNNPSSFGTSGSIAVGQATYVGSIFGDVTPGQVSCYRSWGGGGGGAARKWGVWNAYNRVPIVLQGGDSTASWTYAGNSVWRQSRADAANQLALFTGLAEETLEIVFDQTVINQTNGLAQIGVGMNSTTSPSGYSYLSSSGLQGLPLAYKAKFIQPPQLGVTNANMIEKGGSGTVPVSTFNGTISNMIMTARYSG